MGKPPKPNEGYYRSLNRNIVLIIVSVSVIPLALITLTLFYYFESSYRGKVNEHLRVLVLKHKQNIDSFLSERLADIQAIVDSNSFEQLSDENVLNSKLRILQKNFGSMFIDLGVIDQDGNQVTYAGPFNLKNARYGDAPWFKQAMSTQDYISNVFPGLRGIPHFIVAAKGTSDGKKWLLRATVDFDKFSSLVEGIRIGQTGSAFIINREGEFQTKPNPVAVPLISRYIGRLTSSEAAVNSPRSVELSEISTEDILYVTSDLKKGEWVLIFQQTISDAYSALFTAKAITLTIFIIGSILIAATAILLSRRVVKRITSADQEKEMMNEKVVEAGKLASLGELAAGIAHEINNPVAVMVEEAGWLQDLLAEETGASIEAKEEFQRSLDQIRTQGARCKQITHKLLSFARKTDPIPKKVNINDVVREAVALCQQRIRSGNLKLVSVLGDDLPLIRVSPTEAQQVLINLINNAVDALEAQGGLVQITTRSEEDYVVVDVEDNGPGIPSYVLPRIFDPFFTTKQVGKGTGLGLSICYGIMKKLDGEITVNTSEGLGTQFHVKFPIPKAKRKSA